MLYSKKTFNFHDITDKVKTWFVIIVLTLITAILLISYYKTTTVLTKIEKIPQEVRIMVLNDADEFTKAKFIKEINRLNLKFPHIVFAQAVKESNFNSTIFNENNNMFGMKVAKSRPTTSTGTNRNHATFDTWRDCLIDYSLYQAAYLRNVKTEDQYYQYLRSYAEDPNYSVSVKKIADKWKKHFKKIF